MASSPFPRGCEMYGLARHVMARPPRQDIASPMPVEYFPMRDVRGAVPFDPVAGLALIWAIARTGLFVDETLTYDDSIESSL